MSEMDHSPSDKSPDPRNSSNRLRRVKACKHCHSLKVKCAPVNPDDPYSPCVRCTNSNRVCEIEMDQPRKRRKKSAVNASISDLHDQIALLKEQLSEANSKLASRSSSPNNSNNPTSTSAHISSLPPNNNSPLSSQGDADHPYFVSKYDLKRELSLLNSNGSSLSDITNQIKKANEKRNNFLRSPNEKLDVVSHGLISMDEARVRLDLYKRCIYSRHPLIELPPNATVESMIKSEPFLFNTIMSVSSSVAKENVNQEQCLKMDIFVSRTLINEIMVCGTKSIELIKAVVLLTVWHNSPEFFKQRCYHILNNIAVTLLHDLGIVGRPSYTYSSESKMLMKKLKDSNSIQCRALIMVLYFTTVSICMILRRSIFVKWTPYVSECCSILEHHPDEKYRDLALFLRLNHELERIHHIIHSDVDQTRQLLSKYIVDEFQGRLSLIKGSIPLENHVYRAYYYSVEAYLHQPAVSEIQVNDRDGTGCSQKLNSETLTSISKCTASCLHAIEEFGQLDAEGIASLPLFCSSRVIYTVGVLLRMRFLILSLPSLVEKDLVPRHAIVSVSKLSLQFQAASSLHPANQFLKKMRLILQLFIQTYVTQVLELVRQQKGPSTQHDGVSKQQFSNNERKEMAKYANALCHRVEGVMTADSEKPSTPTMHLDLLSYAASFRRNSEDGKSDGGDGADDEGGSEVSPNGGTPGLSNEKKADSPAVEDKKTQLKKEHPSAMARGDVQGALPTPTSGPTLDTVANAAGLHSATFNGPGGYNGPIPRNGFPVHGGGPVMPPQQMQYMNQEMMNQQMALGPFHPQPQHLQEVPPGMAQMNYVGMTPAQGQPLQPMWGDGQSQGQGQTNETSQQNMRYPTPHVNNEQTPMSGNGGSPVLSMDSALGKEPFYSISDEFWLNLLSTDSDRVHFSQEIPDYSDEMFFVN